MPQLRRRNRQAPDLLELLDNRGVGDERDALLIARCFGKQHAVVAGQFCHDGPQAAEVVVDLLDGDDVKPADDLREQAVVFCAALLHAEVRDVPRRQQQLARGASGDTPQRGVRSKRLALPATSIGKSESHLGRGKGH